MERSVAVIDTCTQKIRQHIVVIGSTNQSVNRQSHLFGIVTGQNVAKIASRHDKIYRFAAAKLAGFA